MERVERKNASTVSMAYTLPFPFGGIFFSFFCLRFKRRGNYSADLITKVKVAKSRQRTRMLLNSVSLLSLISQEI